MNNSKLKQKFSSLFRSENSRFLLSTGFKVAGISFLVSFLVAYMLWVLMAINNIFLEANGFMGIEELRQAYFDYILSTSVEKIPFAVLFFIALFFAGIYMGKILMRPFEIIGKYCEETIEDKNATYNPDLFSDYKLLTRFSEFFFQYLSDCRKEGRLKQNSIPPQFTKIHKPVFDRVFFFHFFLFISMISIIVAGAILATTVDIHENTINLTISSLKNYGYGTTYFFQNQNYVIESIQKVTVVIISSSYFLLSLHLYTKVSGAAFGFFSTMRSFMKGNYSARVHLLGYNQLRPFGRSLNRYLKFMQENFAEEKNKRSKSNED